MPVHHFTLIVDGVDLRHESLVDSLLDAGCDDALVGSTDGVQFIDFDREAASLDEAVRSAVADVEQVPGVQVVRMDSHEPSELERPIHEISAASPTPPHPAHPPP